MNFLATYYNGTSAIPYTTEIVIERDGLKISYSKSEEEKITLFWGHDLIQRNDISDKKVILKYGKEFPYETLEISSPEFLKEIEENAPYAKYAQNHYHKFNAAGSKALLLGLAGIVAFALFSYFFIIPAIMVGAATVFPQELEVEMGKKMLPSFISEKTKDSARTEDINKFYQQLEVDTDYEINITVVKSDVQNAFALPGGEVVVFSALLDSMKTYEQLVALLGHEVGHVQKRHSLKMLFKSLANYIVISAIFQDISGLMAVVIDNAATLEQLSYNREIETESDIFGYEVLRQNKIDPQGMVMLFEQLNHSGSDTYIPAFLSTHPKLSERIIETKERMKKEAIIPQVNDSLAYYFKKLKERPIITPERVKSEEEKPAWDFLEK